MFAGIGGFRLGLERANNLCRKHRQTEERNRGTETPVKSSQTTSESLRSEGNSSNSVKSGDSGQIQHCCFTKGLEKTNLAIGTSPQQGFRNIQGGCDAQLKNSSPTFTCVWSNEIDKYATQIYHKNFGSKELIQEDIRKIETEDIPEADMLVAGFPCQSFSFAGKRKGFKDVRGTLFYEIARIAEAKRPKLLLLENVKGLLSAQGGYCFWRILSILDELGYDLQWQVLNSKYFGVPQNRERVFIIGHLRGKSGCQIFPLRQNGEEHNEKPIQGHETTSTLRATYYKNPQRGSYINTIREGNTKHLISMGNGRPNRNCLRSGRTPELNIGKQRIRRLTPIECERLQSFPDGWTDGISDTQRYKCLGNAVTVNVIEFLGEQILNAMSQ